MAKGWNFTHLPVSCFHTDEMMCRMHDILYPWFVSWRRWDKIPCISSTKVPLWLISTPLFSPPPSSWLYAGSKVHGSFHWSVLLMRLRMVTVRHAKVSQSTVYWPVAGPPHSSTRQFSKPLVTRNSNSGASQTIFSLIHIYVYITHIPFASFLHSVKANQRYFDDCSRKPNDAFLFSWYQLVELFFFLLTDQWLKRQSFCILPEH